MSRTDSIRLERFHSRGPFSFSLCLYDHALKSSVRALRAHLSLKFTHLCGSIQNSAAGILGWILRWILGLLYTSFHAEPAAQDKVEKGENFSSSVLLLCVRLSL